jgi:hypothetical protein
VLVRNADAYLTDDLEHLLRGWDGRRPRVLGVDQGTASDFGTVRYVGASLIPADAAIDLPDAVGALYDLVWRPAELRGVLDVVLSHADFVDCGTPRDYLAANMLASGGANVIGQGAQVLGQVERVVVWPNGVVRGDESLHDCIRADADLTVYA